MNHPDATGSVVFVTFVVKNRYALFADADACTLFMSVLHQVKSMHPFSMSAYILLPDHVHLMVRPLAPAQIDEIVYATKAIFTRENKRRFGINGRMEVWQERFWDHVIRDDEDFNYHLNYIHANCVHHGYVHSSAEWHWSSFGKWMERGLYEESWSYDNVGPLMETDEYEVTAYK